MKSLSLTALMAMSLWALPPGAPMSDFGPKQVAISASFDHNGLFLFEEGSPSILNTVGIGVEYAPWRVLQVGLFGGASEFDIGVPESQKNNPNVYAFNTDYSFTGGASIKLATPRFAGDALRLVAYGSGQWLQAEDPYGNERMGLYYQGGATFQWSPTPRLTLVLGGEYQALDGTQKNSAGGELPFGLQGTTPVEACRGLVGVEYVFPQKNRPFMSVSFRPTGSIGWDDHLGVQGGSVAVSFGVMTDLGSATIGHQEEEADHSPIEE